MRQDHKNVAGWWIVGDKTCYFKSLFERDVACLLELCKRHRQLAVEILGHKVGDWEYEPRCFRYYGPDIKKGLQGKRHGITCYTPDFYIDCAEPYYIETKGYMGGRDYSRIKYFKTYYPQERLLIIVRRLPTGKAASGRETLVRYQKIEQLGYKVLVVGGVLKSCEGLMRYITAPTEKVENVKKKT